MNLKKLCDDRSGLQPLASEPEFIVKGTLDPTGGSIVVLFIWI